jgi:hypothetical protein
VDGANVIEQNLYLPPSQSTVALKRVHVPQYVSVSFLGSQGEKASGKNSADKLAVHEAWFPGIAAVVKVSARPPGTLSKIGILVTPGTGELLTYFVAVGAGGGGGGGCKDEAPGQSGGKPMATHSSAVISSRVLTASGSIKLVCGRGKIGFITGTIQADCSLKTAISPSLPVNP